MRFDPAEMVAGVEAALKDERGFAPTAPESVHRLAEIVCSLMNEDGAYSRQDLEQHVKDMHPNYYATTRAAY